MRKITLVITIIFIVCLSSCVSTGRTSISNSANLANYSHVTFADKTDGNISAVLTNRVREALIATRLQVVDAGQVESLPDDVKRRLLVVRLDGMQNTEGYVMNIVFSDYTTGKTVASCRGSHKKGWTRQIEMQTATANALARMKQLF
jgi:hypothetical protein